jgi:hypothetical protein
MPIDVDRMLQQAVRRLEAGRQQLDQRIAAIRAVVVAGAGTPARAGPARRGMSPAARREVSRRMKAYWAKRRAQKAGTARAAAGKTKAKGPVRAKRSANGKAGKAAKGASTTSVAT